MVSLCDYGCGQEAKYFFKNGKKCCSKNHRSCPMIRNKGIPDPKTNIANIKVKCKYCNDYYAYSNIKIHQKSCYLNPDNLRLCPNCNNPIKSKENQYCSSRCAALITTPGRKHTLETKIKISKSLGGDGLKDKKCLKCGVDTINGRLYCDSCLPIILGENSSWEKACLSFSYYEKDLSLVLEQFYGKLNKEKINGIFPDFCNEKYIIDFTFDSTKGTNDLIKRFRKIKDSRKKIAYIPNKNVSETRRNRLIIMGVEIKNSELFRYLLERNNNERSKSNKTNITIGGNNLGIKSRFTFNSSNNECFKYE